MLQLDTGYRKCFTTHIDLIQREDKNKKWQSVKFAEKKCCQPMDAT